jgi:hypothetical protein
MMGEGRLGRVLAMALLALVLTGVAVVLAQNAPDREGLLRYAIAALIVLSVAPSHALLPDPAVSWLQRLNRPPAGLLGRALGRWAGVVLAVLAPAAGVAAWVGNPLAATVPLLLLAGVALYAFQDTMAIGPISQDWQEGRRGRFYRELVARDPRASFQVPHGMVPAMLASLRIFVVGFVAIVATVVALAVGGAPAGWMPAAALLAWSGWKLARLAPDFDRAYYHTSGLYAELLHTPIGKLGARPDLPFDAVYWVPPRWRPHAWGALLQLDRRLPMGKLMALAVAGLWALMAFGVASAGITAYLLAAILAKNAAVLRHASPDIAPPAFHLARQSVANWAITRFWMNVRWTVPLALGLGAVAFVSVRMAWGEVILWTAVDLLFALVFSLVATYAAEHRYSRRFA